MKTLPSPVQALFAKRSFIAATLYSFTLITGQVLNYTSNDRDITYNGTTYSSGSNGAGPFIERSVASGGQATTCSWKTGLDVGNLEFDLIPGAATINGVPFLVAVKNGVFDGATLARYRAYMDVSAPTVCLGTIMLDFGRVAEIMAGRSYATFTINDFRELLNIQMPRRLYQAGCINSLYDASCGLNRASFTATGTATAGSTASIVNVSGLTAAADFYDLGVITFTSGQNDGLSRTVKQYTSGVVQVIVPFPNVPAAGDAFTIYPGCAKTTTACQAFGNISNFNGQPYIPDPSTAT